MNVRAHIQYIAGFAKSLGIDALFVAITLAAMTGGWFATRADASTLALLHYALAYTSGSYFGIIESRQSLREHKIDTDLLMVLATGGGCGRVAG